MHMRPLPGQSATLTVMLRAVQSAAKHLIRDFEELEHLQVSERGTHKFVQIAEKNVSQSLKKELLKVRPTYGLLIKGESEIDSSDGQYRWIVDPLNGTENFGHGIPYFAVSVALEKDGELIAGVVYDVLQQRCYFAEKGFGCYMNGRRLRVSGRRYLNHCMMCTNFPMEGTADQRARLMQTYFQTLSRVAPEITSFRSLGAVSLDLAYVAAGKFDGIWLNSVELCEVAAGTVLIKEAGGYASDFSGQPVVQEGRHLVASNAEIHKELISILKA